MNEIFHMKYFGATSLLIWLIKKIDDARGCDTVIALQI